jgi:NitT/TauT family transport system ATP-binding protein
MDEPFGSVDAYTRAELEDLILAVRDRYGMTIVLVTHDIDESVYLGDRILVLSRAPAHVVDVIDVDLPRKRDQITTPELPTFIETRARVARGIFGAREGGNDRRAEGGAA